MGDRAPPRTRKYSAKFLKGPATLARYGPSKKMVQMAALMAADPAARAAAQQMVANREADNYVGAGRYKRKLRMYGYAARRRLRGGQRGDYNTNFSIFGNAAQSTQHFRGGGSYGGGSGEVVNNAIVNGGAGTGIPSFAPHESEYTVSKQEFVRSIYAPATAGEFQNTVLQLQPGLQQTFPWLGLIAPQFEEYEMRQMIWYWRPMVSDFNSGTGQVGEIIMVTQYNPTEEAFTDVLRAKSYDGAMSAKTSCAMNHGVECEPKLNSGAAGKYIRVGPLNAFGVNSGDLKQYDQGNLNVIITGTPAAYNSQLLGELWCAYTVTLRKPKLPQSTGDTILRDYFEAGGSAMPGVNIESVAGYPIKYGAQNRINDPGTGMVMSNSPNSCTWKYIFPDWYTGDVTVTLRLVGVTFLSGTGAAPITPETSYIVGGNIVGIRDIATQRVTAVPNGLQQASTDNTKWAIAGTTANTSVSDTLILVRHIRVSSQTNGVQNTVGFNIFIGTGIRADAVRACGWTFDVSEYNTGFNDKSGQIQLVDGTDEPIASAFPATA